MGKNNNNGCNMRPKKKKKVSKSVDGSQTLCTVQGSHRVNNSSLNYFAKFYVRLIKMKLGGLKHLQQWWKSQAGRGETVC